MKLVKNNRRDSVERRIVDEHTFHNALRDYFNACTLRNFRLESHPVAYSRTYPLPYHRGHPQGNLAGGRASRLKHDYLALRYGIGNRQRHQS